MCTGIRFTSTAGDMFFGRNLDWSCGYGEKVRIAPVGFPMTYKFCDDTLSKRAVIGMCVDYLNYPMFFDCGNDAGLAVAGLNFPGFAEYAERPEEGKVNICAFEFPFWVAANFSTVSEVKSALPDVLIVGASAGKGLGVSYLHWLIGDSEQSIVVESVADGLHVVDDPVDVLANQPSIEWHLENLRSFVTVGNEFAKDVQWGSATLAPYGAGASMRGIPGDSYSPSRFVKAAFLNTHYPQKDSERDNVIRCFRTLEGVAMVEGASMMGNGEFEKTLYTSCFSGASGRYYYSDYDNPAIRYVSLDMAEGADSHLLVTPDPVLL